MFVTEVSTNCDESSKIHILNFFSWGEGGEGCIGFLFVEGNGTRRCSHSTVLDEELQATGCTPPTSLQGKLLWSCVVLRCVFTEHSIYPGEQLLMMRHCQTCSLTVVTKSWHLINVKGYTAFN